MTARVARWIWRTAISALCVSILLISAGLTAAAYDYVGPFLDDTFGHLYVHQPRMCDSGGPYIDGTNTLFCYNFYLEDTPNSTGSILTWIRWGVTSSAEYDAQNPGLWWGPTWIVDYTSGNQSTQYIDYMCAPWSLDPDWMTPYYYETTPSGTTADSIQQYVYDMGSCPEGPGYYSHAFYEEIFVKTRN